MIEFDKNSKPLIHSFLKTALNLNGKRFIFNKDGGSGRSALAAGAERAKEEEKKVHTLHKDFDNQNFATEKSALLDNSLDQAIDDILKQVEELQNSPSFRETVRNELKIGLEEIVSGNFLAIAKKLKETNPKLGETFENDFNKEKALMWFQNVLINLNCQKIGIVHDKESDTTKFRFYDKQGNEILFPNTDVKIKYSESNQDIIDANSQTYKAAEERAQRVADQRLRLREANENAAKARQQVEQTVNHDALVQGRRMFLENRTIKSDQLRKFVRDPELFRKAWENPQAFQGISEFIYILQQPPFNNGNKGPGFYRDRIIEAIGNGAANALDMEDIFNYILRGTPMPSLAPSTTEFRWNPINNFNTLTDPESADSGRRKIAAGFLKALGVENSSQIIRYEDDDKILIRFNYEDRVYAVKLDYDSVLDSDSTLEVFMPNGKTKYFDQYGYDNKVSISNEDLLAYADKATAPNARSKAENRVKAAFENLVTPKLGKQTKYDDLVKMYKRQETISGKKTSEIFPFNDMIIGATKLMDAATRLQIDKDAVERSEQKERRVVTGEYYQILHNNSAVNKHKEFSTLMRDKKAFMEAWLNGKIKGKDAITRIFKEEPIFSKLRQLPPEELAEKLYDAIYKGNKEGLDAADIYNLLLDKELTNKSFSTGLASKTDFQSIIGRYFDANGRKDLNSLTPEQQKEYEYCNNFIAGASRLLRIFPTLNHSETFLSGEYDVNSTKLNNAGNDVRLDQIAEQQPGKDNWLVYNIEDLINNSHSNVFDDVGTTIAGNVLPEQGAGLTVHQDVTKNLQLKEGTPHEMIAALKYIFRVYPLDQLIKTGCISRAHNSKGETFYILNKTPLSPQQYKWLSEQILKGGEISQHNLEKLNPQTRLHNLLNSVFPETSTKGTYTDAEAAAMTVMDRGIERRMDLRFARERFLEITGQNEQLNEKAFTTALTGYLKQGIYVDLHTAKIASTDASGFIIIENKVEMAPADQELVNILNTYDLNNPNRVLTVAQLQNLMKDPKALNALRKGFERHHNEEVIKEREEKIADLQKQFQEWTIEHRSEIGNINSTLDKELKAKGYDEEEIESIKTRALPFFFYAGLGPDGLAIVGGGANLALDIGKGHTIYIGGSIFTGTKTGMEMHTAYSTPKIGRISFIVGVGAGATFGKESGIGYGAGFGVPIDIYSGRNEHTLTPGIVFAPPFGVVPGITYTIGKGHEKRLEALEQVVMEKTGFDKIEKQPTDEAKVAAIRADQKISEQCKAYLNNGSPSNADYLRAYTEIRNDLYEQLVEKYDPGTVDSLTFGLGFNPDGRIIFGIGASFYVGKETLSTAKGTSNMDLENTLAMRRNLEEQELNREDLHRYAVIAENGESIKVAGEEGKRVGTARVLSSNQERSSETPINTVEALTEDLNRVLKPLNLEVEYSSKMKMFKLNILDINSNLNVLIAADHAMESGGMYFDGTSTYFTHDFANTARLMTIQRADYHFPKTKQSANNLAIITISDNPLRTYGEILNSSPEVIRYQNGVPMNKPQQQFATRLGSPIESRIYTPNEQVTINGRQHSSLKMLQNSFKQVEPVDMPEPIQNSAEFIKNRDSVLLETKDIGTLLHSKEEYEKFADKFEKMKPILYRTLSNAESEGADTRKLSEIISKEYKKFFKTENEPNPTELNFIRDLLVRETAVENKNTIRPNDNEEVKRDKAEWRKHQFEHNLKVTKATTEKRFKNLIESYNSKLPEGDPRRINRTAKELVNKLFDDLQKNRNSLDAMLGTDSNTRHLSDTESYEYVAGSRQIRGFRGEYYQRNLDKVRDNEMKLLMVENYADILKNSPQEWKADLAKIYLEAHSAIPKLSENFNAAEARELVRSPLGMKILSYYLHKGNEFAYMLSDKTSAALAFRETIAAIANPNNKIENLTENQKTAVQRFETILNGIRNAEYAGQKIYENPFNKEYVFHLDEFVMGDGVYNICTNYSTFIDEKLRLEVKGKAIPQYGPVLAARNDSTDLLRTETQNVLPTIAGAAAVSVKPGGGGGGGRPKANPPAAEGGSGQGPGTENETHGSNVGNQETPNTDNTNPNTNSVGA